MRRNGFKAREINAPKRMKLLIMTVVTAAIAVPSVRTTGGELDCRAQSTDANRLSESFRRATEQVLPAVVTIETMNGPRKTKEWAVREMSLQYQPELLDAGKELSPGFAGRSSYGTGSGIIIDRRGFILTCHHVIESADTISIYLADGRRFHPAEVWTDATADLAVIRIEGAKDLPEAKLGDSELLQAGDWVVSVGDPYGLGLSVSAGIVSSTDRQLPDAPYAPVIQTDAATNPGNSGGALINLSGEVIGVVEGGFGSGAGFQGIGFAIPVNLANRIAQQLIEGGRIRRASLGCHVNPLSPTVARHLGLVEKHGVIVSELTARSPADAAGIQLGDVLTHFSNREIADPYQLRQMIDQAEPNRPYEVTILRGSQRVKVEVQLELPRESDDVDYVSSHDHAGHRGEGIDESLGLNVDELGSETARELGFSDPIEGVLITNVVVGGVAYREGVSAGMVILRVADQRVRDLAEYRAAMKNKSLDKGVLVLVGSSEGNHFVVFQR